MRASDDSSETTGSGLLGAFDCVELACLLIDVELCGCEDEETEVEGI